LWQLIRKERPDDGEADRKLKDLAVSATISRGQYNEAVADAEHGRTPTHTPVIRPKAKAPPTAAPDEQLSPGEERLRRDTGPLKARLENDPTNASLYLQLARAYRHADHLEQARKTLTDGLAATGNAFELTVELLDLEIDPHR